MHLASRTSAVFTTAVMLWLVHLPADAADWALDFSAALQHDDNVSNALAADDRKSDTAGTLNLSTGLHQQLRPATGLSGSVIAESVTYSQYSGLSNVGVGGRVQVRQKFGLGSQAPWAAIAISTLYRDFHYDLRDGWQYDANASVGRRFGERWSARASARYDRYRADDLPPSPIPGVSSAVYDTAGMNLGASAQFLATERDVLSLSYIWRNGSVTAVTPRTPAILQYSQALARDTVFDPTWVAYRLDARTSTVSVNWSHALARTTALNLGYTYRTARPDSGNDEYYANIINLSFSYSR